MIASETDASPSETQHILRGLSLGQPTAPFPSPSSSFMPSPMPSSHEFANKTSWVRAPPATSTSAASKNKAATTATDPSASLPNGHSVPKPINVETAQAGSAAAAVVASPSTPTQTLSVSTSSLSPTPATPSFSHRNSGSAGLSDLSASRIAPPSPAPSRRSSTRRRSRGATSSLSGVSTTATPSKAKASREIKIRDFAFVSSDPRHIGQGIPLPDTPDSRRSSSGGWSGFRWNQIASKFSSWTSPASEKRQSQSMPSQTDFDRNFTDPEPEDEDEGEYVDGEYEDEGEADHDEELRPGWYRALYAFEPEGTAEMALREDQRVRVLGRGGGVGWAVVRGLGGCALVPESYLEWVGPFAPGEEDEEEDEDGDAELQRGHTSSDREQDQPEDKPPLAPASGKQDSANGTPKLESRGLP